MSTGSFPFLTGEIIILRPLFESDADGPYPTWFNDEEVCWGNGHHIFPYTPQAAKEYIQNATKTREHLILAIVSKDNNRHIGNVALQKIHPIYRSAEFSIIIGDKSTWGQGVGKEAGRLLCDHGFHALNLHRIHCGTFANNTAMQHLAAYLGMKQEGVRRQAAFKDGQYLDIIEYGVLKSEYEAHWA
ncbi:MAG: GNAT family N-acetyltransferase [Anaerolineales bacterium]|nr:GNAT family N-acetyltransferase [Chloroflexota bacterium]MBL6980219.1 GNAT family N-acetyltransferase [Anaerolineales bacterium]